MASGNVPDFDGAVVATASDKFAVRRKSHGGDPVIETSQHMKHTGREEDHQKKLTRLSARSASTCKPNILHFYIFSIYLSEKVTISSGLSHGHSQEHNFLVSSF